MEGMLSSGSDQMHLTAERVSYLHEQDIEELLNVIKETCRPSVE